MIALCALQAIADPGAKGFVVDGVDLFVVRRGDRVFGYRNSCPHIGTPLEFLPDRFLTRDGTEILCTTHGARFAIDTGLCVHGPCKGQHLTPIETAIVDGGVVVGL